MKKISPLAAMTSDPEMASEVERLRDLPMPELIAEYRRVWGKEPRIKHRAYLWKRTAWKIQEARTGGLSNVAKKRLEELIGQLGIDFGQRTVSGVLNKKSASETTATLTPGTSLVRDWKRQRLTVHALEKGFEFGGEVFPSLTAVAKKITGGHCSGPAFFGLSKKAKSRTQGPAKALSQETEGL